MLNLLAVALRRHRTQEATRWRKLSPGRRALLVVAYLRRPGRSAGVDLTRIARARHDTGAAREHGLIHALNTAGIRAIADTAHQGGGPAVRVPQRRRRLDPDTGRYRRLSRAQKDKNTAYARQRGPGERVNADLKNWRILRRSAPAPAGRPIPSLQFRPS